MTPLTTAVRAACGRLRNGVPSCEWPTCGCPLSVAMSPVFAERLITTARAEATEAAARVAREQVAAFMGRHSLATGHGDTLADLLGELGWQIGELQGRQTRPSNTMAPCRMCGKPADTASCHMGGCPLGADL